MLSELEFLILNIEFFKLGEAVAKFMKGKICVGSFTVHNNHEIMKWVRSMFDGITYDSCHLYDPQHKKIEEHLDMNNYEGIIMLDVRFNMNENHVKFRKTSTIEFGGTKFVPALYICYEVNLTEDDEEIFNFDRLENGILYWKYKKGLK